MEDMSRLGTREITLTGGEVSGRNDFVEIVNKATEKFCIVNVLTNGYYITDENIYKIRHNSNKNILWQVSIDGLENVHNSIRGTKNSYKKAIEAIEILKRYQYFVSISSTINKENVDQMEAIYQLIKELKVDRLSFGMIIEKGRAKNSEIEVNKFFIDKYQYLLKKSQNDGIMIDFDNVDFEKEDENQKYKKGCGLGTNFLGIQPNGNVVLCPAFDIPIGNIREKSINEIISIQNLKSIYQLIPPSKELCSSCKVIKECENCHAVPYNKNLLDCKWKEINKKILGELIFR